MIEVKDYVQIADSQERMRARAAIVIENTGAWAERPLKRRKAELLAAEAALSLLPYFEREGGEPAEGEERPAYVLFDYNPTADPSGGGSTDIFRVLNRQGVRLWDRVGGVEIESDVTDFLAGAIEMDSAVFYTAGSRWAYALPI